MKPFCKTWAIPFFFPCLLLSGCGAGVAGDAGIQLVGQATYQAATPNARFTVTGYPDSLAIVTAPGHLYVAADGDDTAAGTQAAPFQTLARAALAARVAGTAVWVAPGTYDGSFPTATVPVVYISTTLWGATLLSSTPTDAEGGDVRLIGFAVDSHPRTAVSGLATHE